MQWSAAGLGDLTVSVNLSPREEITCPSCGSSFCLENQSTTAGTLSSGQRLGRFRVAVHDKGSVRGLLESPGPTQETRLIGMAAEAV